MGPIFLVSPSVFVTDDVTLIDKFNSMCYQQYSLVGNKIKTGNKKLLVSRSKTRLTDDIPLVAVVTDEKQLMNFLVDVPFVTGPYRWCTDSFYRR